MLGGAGSIVQTDETFRTPKKGFKTMNAGHHRIKVVSPVRRDGKTRAFHVANVDAANLSPILRANLAKEFSFHGLSNHVQKEYAKPSKVQGVQRTATP